MMYFEMSRCRQMKSRDRIAGATQGTMLKKTDKTDTVEVTASSSQFLPNSGILSA